MGARHEIQIPVDGTFLAAWFYLPDGVGPHPVVVMARGLGGVREMRLDAYAERFVAAGLGATVFDYRHPGASGGWPRQLVSVRRQLQDLKTGSGMRDRLLRSIPIGWHCGGRRSTAAF